MDTPVVSAEGCQRLNKYSGPGTSSPTDGVTGLRFYDGC